MHPYLPHPANTPSPESGGWGLVFQAVSSISLAVVTSKLLFEMLRDRKENRHKTQRADEDLGPLVRREVERALAEHDARSGRGS
jgi:hypothetical protein